MFGKGFASMNAGIVYKDVFTASFDEPRNQILIDDMGITTLPLPAHDLRPDKITAFN